MTVTAEPTNRVRPERPVRRRAAMAAAAGFLVVAAFEVALALGAPFGAAAFGGTNAGTLPPPLRVAGGVSAAVWIFAALLILSRGGLSIAPLPKSLARRGTWILAGYLGLGTVMNVASSSPWERYGWASFSLAMMILCIVVARGGVAPSKKRLDISF
ncbi:MAG: hypothetical protein JWM49_1113 [Microbacteriaceae bacterium]|nr:hypothetical protein [Microbacteriaceae bacterium]